MSGIVERIEREAGVPGLAAILAKRLAPTDLQSLLLEVYRRRAAAKNPPAILSEYIEGRFVRPSPVSPEALVEWERVALSSLPEGFEAVELSPVCPLGSSSSVAGVDQNWAVSTARNNEVVSDSTNVLALEAAARRRGLLAAKPKSGRAVNLAARHRLLRAQKFDGPASFAHFHCFALASAGRDHGGKRFEFESACAQLRVHLFALRRFLGDEVILRVTASSFDRALGPGEVLERLLAPAAAGFRNVETSFDPDRAAGRGYYSNLCFKIHALAPDLGIVELGDGGAVDWTSKLLGNAKERLVISGVGGERLVLLFGRDESSRPVPGADSRS